MKHSYLFLIVFIFLGTMTSFAQRGGKIEESFDDYFFFKGDKATLLEESKDNLEDLRKMMKRNRCIKIELRGHTNGCGHGKKSSEELSFQRAQTVKDYLVDNGIKAKKIKVKGYGCSDMLYEHPHGSREEKMNRRVEVKILSY